MTKSGKSRMFKMPQGRFSLRDMFMAWWPALLVVAAGFGIAAQYVKPAPPDRVVIATGAEDGAYFYYAGRYADYFDEYGIKLEVRATTGSVENFRLLAEEDSTVDIAFVQDGVATSEEGPYLESLGAMYFEPVWVFYRASADLERLGDLQGLRLAIGPEGSGTRKLARQLLAANAVREPKNRGNDLAGDAAAKALREGRVDAAVMVASPHSKAVRSLLADSRVRLLSFAQAAAYTKHFPYLTAVTLPRGAIDLVNDIPPQDVQLVATTANLLVRDDLHPAIVKLMAAAAKQVHEEAGLFSARGAFPDVKDTEFPMNADAERYYRSGPPFLQRFLPFWAAIQVDRMIVFLVPLIALVLPLMRVAPALYQWRIRSRIYRNYGELKFLEAEVIQGNGHGRIADFLRRLDHIEDRVNQIRVPLAYQEHLYTLRGHIDLVRTRIAKLAADAGRPPAD